MTPDDWTRAIGAGLILFGVLLALAVLIANRADRRRKIQAAKRRHPSARTSPDFTSDAARKYHGDRSVGRD